MINKIQKYLLLHFPIVWNVRLIPMIFVLLIVHSIFFAIGYLSTDIEFSERSYYNFPWGDFEILYFISILISILLLIGWLIFYSRNNGFKTFYPKKTNQLFFEWIMIFIISIGIAFVPFSLSKGHISKWKSVASFDEAQKAQEILDQAHILIPESRDRYDYNDDYHKPIPVPAGMNLNVHTLDLDNYSVQYSSSGNLIIRGYTGPSLLFYSNYLYYDYYSYATDQNTNLAYVDSSDWNKVRRSEQVKKWLSEGDKEKIISIMKDFESLQRKHNMPVNLTPEIWFKRIYNPPFFPVNKSTMINDYQPTRFYDYNDLPSDQVEVVDEVIEPDIAVADTITYALSVVEPYPDDISVSSYPYLQYEELAAGYQQVMRCYADRSEVYWFIMVSFCFSLIIAVFVFSFRVTNGKSWLIALVSTGILLFTIILFAVALGQSFDWKHDEIIIMFVTLFWIILFVFLLSKIIAKVINKSQKGRSNIYMNVMLWIFPCLIPLLFLTVIAHSEFSDLNYFEPKEQEALCMFGINILVVLLSMWAMSALIRRWKSIADE